MWWKLSALATATIVAVICVVPIRSHAVKYDVVSGDQARRPPRLSLRQMIGNMYLTRGALALIAIILAIAAVVAFGIVRAA